MMNMLYKWPFAKRKCCSHLKASVACEPVMIVVYRDHCMTRHAIHFTKDRQTLIAVVQQNEWLIQSAQIKILSSNWWRLFLMRVHQDAWCSYSISLHRQIALRQCNRLMPASKITEITKGVFQCRFLQIPTSIPGLCFQYNK